MVGAFVAWPSIAAIGTTPTTLRPDLKTSARTHGPARSLGRERATASGALGPSSSVSVPRSWSYSYYEGGGDGAGADLAGEPLTHVVTHIAGARLEIGRSVGRVVGETEAQAQAFNRQGV